jgi:ribonuclease HII
LAGGGVDEVGRGPLAGPGRGGRGRPPPRVRASTGRRLEAAAPDPRGRSSPRSGEAALAVGIGAASVREIDGAEHLSATARAMDRALGSLPRFPSHVVVDGRPVPGLRWEHDAVVGGDGRSTPSPAPRSWPRCAGIGSCGGWRPATPATGGQTNVGYGTPSTSRRYAELGPTPHHRKTFGGVQLDLGLEAGGGHLPTPGAGPPSFRRSSRAGSSVGRATDF